MTLDRLQPGNLEEWEQRDHCHEIRLLDTSRCALNTNSEPSTVYMHHMTVTYDSYFLTPGPKRCIIHSLNTDFTYLLSTSYVPDSILG